MRRLALLLAVTTLALVSAPTRASADPGVSYKPPVDGPVVDPFRPPPLPWEAGNRGIDYAPGAGTPVRASADGEVVFAGQVGGQLHVVVLHADGIRTSYSFLRSIAVHRGDVVRQGQPVGTSGDGLHFGARVGDTYIDPMLLFDGGPPHVFLVPDGVRRAGSEADERSGLRRFLDAGRALLGRAADQVHRGPGALVDLGRDYLAEARGLLGYAGQLNPAQRVARLAQTTADWWQQSHDCTPADVAPPPLPKPRVAVLVGGLGSSSGHDSSDEVDAKGLGYAPQDVVRFSYRGGDTRQQPYGPEDTTVDIRESARRLADLLAQVQRDHPGQEIDLIAHSQGGIVARTALAYEYDDQDRRMPPVAHLVTLAGPHHGADIATALTMVGLTESGETVEWGLGAARAVPFDLRGESVRQLSETSQFLKDLNNRPPPAGVRVTSIASRGDVTVPAVRSRLDGARNVVVSAQGNSSEHSDLPGSDAGRREVALALADRPPTCQSLGNMLADTAVSDGISAAEDLAG
ncbi:MAG: peptidoglycan DD-metalloendopeptidase family protein, partial [Actinomycetota bacterium]|nr:peptidoglycan DD-metalloendopeptidase family protein [Actinomycetota bacterium]